MRFLDLLNLVVEGSLSHLVSPIVVVSFFTRFLFRLRITFGVYSYTCLFVSQNWVTPPEPKMDPK